MSKYRVLFEASYLRNPSNPAMFKLTPPPYDYLAVDVDAQDRNEAIRKARRVLNNLDFDGPVFECELIESE